MLPGRDTPLRERLARDRRRAAPRGCATPATAAAEQIEDAQADVDEPQALEEIIGDKGYHSNQTMVDLDAVNIRTYIAEPARGRRDWSKEPDAQASVYSAQLVGLAPVLPMRSPWLMAAFIVCPVTVNDRFASGVVPCPV